MKKEGDIEFYRSVKRRAKLKRYVDCFHRVIDGSEPYTYEVWKVKGEKGLQQRTECEFCSR